MNSQKTTVKQSLQVLNVDWQFCFRCFTYCIRPLLEYCLPVFHNAIPEYLSSDLQHVQKRALSIISPGNSCNKNLDLFDMSSLYDRRTELCRKFFFNNIIANPSNKLHHLLPPRNIHKYNLRHKGNFALSHISTKRFKNTFIPAMSKSHV